MSFKIKCCTEGWRWLMADDYTFLNVRRCAQGFADYLLSKGLKNEGVVVGYDKRFQSENFAAAVAEVLVGNGLRVYLTNGPTPTPAISYSVLARQAVGAVNITASHNPPADNGFKVRDQHGGAIAPDGLKEIESRIPDAEKEIKCKDLAEGEQKGEIVVFDAAPDYIAQLKRLIDFQPIKDAGLQTLIDPLCGNGAGWVSRLEGGGE